MLQHTRGERLPGTGHCPAAARLGGVTGQLGSSPGPRPVSAPPAPSSPVHVTQDSPLPVQALALPRGVIVPPRTMATEAGPSSVFPAAANADPIVSLPGWNPTRGSHCHLWDSPKRFGSRWSRPTARTLSGTRCSFPPRALCLCDDRPTAVWDSLPPCLPGKHILV